MSVLTREGFHALQAQAADALARSKSALTVLICAGTGCIASGSMKVYENLRNECQERGLSIYVGLTHHGEEEKSLHIKMSGCHGFCEMGCLVHIEPLGGVYVGNVFGAKYKNKAEFVGGTILILIGVKIILEHFGVL